MAGAAPCCWNYIVCGTSLDDVLVEQIKFCSKYFASPSVIKNGHVMLPSTPGYIVGMLDEAIENTSIPKVRCGGFPMDDVLIIGAGAIGRGYLPWVFPEGKYNLTFVDQN